MLFLNFLPHELFLPTQIGSLGLQSLSTYVRTIGWFINVAWKARTHKSKKVEFSDPGVAHSNSTEKSSFVFTHHFYRAMGIRKVQDFKYGEFFWGIHLPVW